MEGQVTKNILKYLRDKGLTKSMKRGTNELLLQNAHIVRRFLRHAP
jgi:hypothetical protein